MTSDDDGIVCAYFERNSTHVLQDSVQHCALVSVVVVVVVLFYTLKLQVV